MKIHLHMLNWRYLKKRARLKAAARGWTNGSNSSLRKYRGEIPVSDSRVPKDHRKDEARRTRKRENAKDLLSNDGYAQYAADVQKHGVVYK